MIRKVYTHAEPIRALIASIFKIVNNRKKCSK